MTNITCTNGHSMVGFGFSECPECDAPWRIKENLHTTVSAGKLVGVSRQAIEKAIRTGRLFAQKAGEKVWVIKERDLLSVYSLADLRKATTNPHYT